MSGTGLRHDAEGKTPAVVRYLFANIWSSDQSRDGRSKDPEPDLDKIDEADLDDDLLDDDFELSEKDAEELGATTEQEIDPLDDDDLDLLEKDTADPADPADPADLDHLDLPEDTADL